MILSELLHICFLPEAFCQILHILVKHGHKVRNKTLLQQLIYIRDNKVIFSELLKYGANPNEQKTF